MVSITVPDEPIFPLPLFLSMVASCSITCYIAVDIAVCILLTFKRYSGLYFWSMQVMTWSLLGNNLTNMVIFITLFHPKYSLGSFAVFTWSFMVGSQALVLYSRLHLIVHDYRQIRWVPYMIGISLVVLLVPRTAFFYAAKGVDIYLPSYIYHKVALCGLFLQELVICIIYIREAIHALKPVSAVEGRNAWKVLIFLIIANVLIPIFSGTIVITEFVWFVPTELSFHALSYGIKLKLEYFVLNQLCDVTKRCHCLCHHNLLSRTHHDFLTPEPPSLGHNDGRRGREGQELHDFRQISSEITSGNDITMPSPVVSAEHVGALTTTSGEPYKYIP